MMTPFFQSPETVLVCQITENREWRIRSIVGSTYFSSSELRPQRLAADYSSAFLLHSPFTTAEKFPWKGSICFRLDC